MRQYYFDDMKTKPENIHSNKRVNSLPASPQGMQTPEMRETEGTNLFPFHPTRITACF